MIIWMDDSTIESRYAMYNPEICRFAVTINMGGLDHRTKRVTGGHMCAHLHPDPSIAPYFLLSIDANRRHSLGLGLTYSIPVEIYNLEGLQEQIEQAMDLYTYDSVLYAPVGLAEFVGNAITEWTDSNLT